MGLPDLYPAQVGSPYTTLAAPYTTGAATMTVVDAAKTPDAPNIVCLAGSVAGEFRYTGKDGNILQGVAALPGTPAATWPVGAFVFRGIAAYDMNALQQRATSVQNQVDFLAQLNSPIIGIEWDAASASPTLTRIDAAGAPLVGLDPTFFDKHRIFDRRRCTRDRATGEITMSSNGRGDGLVLDGSEGDVLVRKPKYYYKFECEYPYFRYWFSAEPHVGFSVWPAFMQRGDPLNPTAADYLYSGAYEAYGYVDGGAFKLGSAAGKKPVTGNSGTDLEHADWDPYPGLIDANVPDITLTREGEFTITIAEKCASLVGTGFGITNFWNYVGDQLLMYLEFGTFDIQTALGLGVTDLPTGTKYAGLLTGADSIDARLAENGTGVGSGVNGKTPVAWRGIENPYGNVWKFIIGCNFKAGGIFRTIKRDGSGTLAGTMADGSYDEGTGVSTVNGYISGLLEDELGGMAVMPAAVNGSSSTYLCDYWYAPTGDRILRAGGLWNYGRNAGPSCRTADSAVSNSGRSNGARVEFRPPEEA